MTTSLHRHLLLKLSKAQTLGEKGFTLIELLVVIVIIGILSAIALPSFLNQRAKAYDAEQKSIVGATFRALQACRAENTDAYCAGTTAGAAPESNLERDYGAKTTYDNYTLTITAATPSVKITPTANKPPADADAHSFLATINGICQLASATATVCP